jgi:hypothetical protein
MHIPVKNSSIIMSNETTKLSTDYGHLWFRKLLQFSGNTPFCHFNKKSQLSINGLNAEVDENII